MARKRKDAEAARAREDEEDRQLAAASIAIAGGVLRSCAEHPLVLVPVEGADIRTANEYGTRMFESGRLKRFFESKKQMLECIRAAVAEHQRPCSICEPETVH